MSFGPWAWGPNSKTLGAQRPRLQDDCCPLRPVPLGPTDSASNILSFQTRDEAFRYFSISDFVLVRGLPSTMFFTEAKQPTSWGWGARVKVKSIVAPGCLLSHWPPSPLCLLPAPCSRRDEPSFFQLAACQLAILGSSPCTKGLGPKALDPGPGPTRSHMLGRPGFSTSSFCEMCVLE